MAKCEIKRHFFVYFNFLLYKTNRFHVAVRLFSNRSQRTSKCGKNKKVAHEAQPSVSLMFLPHFDVLCDLLLNRRTATWNLFVLYNKKLKRTSKCGKNISDTLGCASCATFLFLPHFDVICDLLLNRRTATWNLFVKWTQADDAMKLTSVSFQ